MKRLTVLTTVGCMALASALLGAGARADDWNRKALITFSSPVEIPGVHLAEWGVLPAGSYMFKILDWQSDRHIVQISNRNETTVYATILAIPNYRLKVADETVATFRERPRANRRRCARGSIPAKIGVRSSSIGRRKQ